MKEFFNEWLQNKNFLMFAFTVSYVLGLFSYFSDKPVLFASIYTVILIALLLKDFPYKIVLIWISVFYLGFINTALRIKNSDELFKLAPSNSVITGQIVSTPNGNSIHNSKFFFKVNSVKIDGETYDNINNKTLAGITDFSKNPDFSKLEVGNFYEISGKLRKPFTATNPSQFSYANYLRNFHTYTTFYADISDVKKIDSKLSLKWKGLKYLSKKRNDILSTHSKYMTSPNNQILGGIVFGDDAVAPPDYIKTSFVHSGLLHILAASGMNVAFISSFLFFFMVRLKVPYNVMLITGILVTILYCLMTGLGASVIRAGLMLIFIFFGKLIDRDAHSISLLSFVALIMLLYNPAFINDVGFQLSFIVTLGIILMVDLVIQYAKIIPPSISSSVLIPIVAQLWVIPIQMFYFNTVSVYSVFANILTIPLLYVISFGGFISSVFSLFSPIADFVCKYFDIILNPCLNILVSISEFFAHKPHSLVITTHPSIIQIFIYYSILVIFVYLLRVKFKNTTAIKSLLSLIFILTLSCIIHIPNHNFEVISFDVGNADAFLLKTPENKYFIIDTGKMGYNGGKSQADMLILKYLRDRGIKNIEGLIITHFDSDHAGGAPDLIRSLRIRNVYMNSLNDDKNLARKIYKTIDLKPNTQKIKAKDGQIIYSEKDFSVKTLKAEIPEHGHDSEANENSVLTLVKSGKLTILFTGDSGVRAFEQIKNEIPQNITVLKVGHHGAKNVINKEMIEYLNPKVSLVSVGYNKYGHPHPLTIKLLSKSKVMRTDKINAIKIISDKNGYEIDGFDSKTKKFYRKYGEKW